MSGIQAVNILALVVSLGVKFYGYPRQLRATAAARRDGRPHGLVPSLLVMMCLSYGVWVIQGVLAGDWVLAASQSAGVVLTVALLWAASPAGRDG